MTSVGPVEQVVTLLEAADYARVEQPRPIGGIPFDFDAMLAGRSSLDLIAVVDLAVQTDDDVIRRNVEALARALDLVRSRRSLTVVLAGPRRGPGLIQAIVGVARVLTVGTPAEGEEAGLHDALAVLLPLEVSAEDEGIIESWTQSREQIVAAHPVDTQAVLAAAPRGAAPVSAALRALLTAPLEAMYDEPDNEDGEAGDQ